MSNNLFNEVVAYVRDASPDTPSQQMLIELALADAPNLRGLIQVGMPAQPFAVLAVRRCIDYGQIHPGKPAASALLDVIHDQVGDVDRKADIRRLQRELGDTTLDAPTAAPVKELPPADNSPAHRHIFISYSSADRGGFVDRFARDLESHGYATWVDNLGPEHGGIVGGTSWKQSLANALNEAAAVVLVMTNESIASGWVQAEIRRAQELNRLLLPVQLRPLSDETRAMLDKLGLRDLQYRKFTENYDIGFKALLADLSYHNVTRAS